MKYKVLRKFCSSVQHVPGEIVELEGGHTEKLVAQRYLIPLTAEEVAALKPASPPPSKPKKAETSA